MEIGKSTLITVFNALTNEELKALQSAIHSPFFNYRGEEARLFMFLLKAKKANKKEYRVEEVCAAVLPSQKPDAAKLRHVMTYLLRIIYRYLNINELEKDEALNRLLLARTLRKRKLGKQFMAQYNDTALHYNEELLLSPSLYYQRLLLNTEHYTHSITDRRPQDANLQQLSTDLDSFFIVQKLKQASSILSYKNIFKNDHEPGLLKEVLELVRKGELLNNPLINALYYSYLTLAEPDNEDHFTELKKTLLNNSNRIDAAELRDIFTLAINYCIKKLNTGNYTYYNEVFAIYKAGLERRVFMEGNILSSFTYKNIASIAIGLKEFNWAYTFIEQYQHNLDKTQRDGFYAYCSARYFFAQQNYNRVTDLLREVEIKDVFTEMDSRVLLVKAYYELDEYDLLGYTIDNFKQLLKRKKLQTYHETVYSNFIKQVKKLLSIKQYDKKAKELFLKSLNETKAIAEKDWLRLKVSR